jgi:hypothetical protein
MGISRLGITDKLPQLGTRQRQIVAASGRSGSYRADTPKDRETALHAADRGFLRRLPAGHEYELTDLGRAAYAQLQAKGLIDG